MLARCCIIYACTHTHTFDVCAALNKLERSVTGGSNYHDYQQQSFVRVDGSDEVGHLVALAVLVLWNDHCVRTRRMRLEI